jgi:hypothetical protein
MAGETETNTVEDKGRGPAVQGAGAESLNQGEGLAGAPAVPADTGRTAPKAGDDEEHGQPLKKEPAPTPDQVTTDDEEEQRAPDWDGNYVQFDDVSGQSVVNLLKEANVGAREANLIFEEAIKSGDINKIKWEVLVEKLGADKAHLAETGIRDYYARVYSRNVATRETAFEIVGGEKNWNKVATWVKNTEQTDPTRKGEFDALRKAIDIGGIVAKRAVEDFKALYEADPNNNGLTGKTLTKGNAPSSRNAGGEPLSRSEYLAELHKAHNSNAKPDAIAALQARRRAGMKAGL